MDENENRVKLELAPEITGGTYSNLAVITHSHSEFIMDFAAMLPGLQGASVRSRIIMAPEHIKRLYAALGDNISKYEAQFGRIEVPGEPPKGSTLNLADFGPIGGTKS